MDGNIYMNGRLEYDWVIWLTIARLRHAEK